MQLENGQPYFQVFATISPEWVRAIAARKTRFTPPARLAEFQGVITESAVRRSGP